MTPTPHTHDPSTLDASTPDSGTPDSSTPAPGTGWMHHAADAVRSTPGLRIDVPHPARVYDYLLGGKDNFPADRAAAEAGLELNPGTRTTARANREFLRRAVTYLTAEAGIRQFLDVGTGLPTNPNVHDIAQAIAPDARVVYTDNDPIVLAHARALLRSPAGHGPSHYLDTDLRKPTDLLTGAAALLDFTQPVGLLLVAVTHHLPDAENPHRLIAQLVDALPGGSYLALSQITADHQPAWLAVKENFSHRRLVLQPRTRARISAFFTGLDLVDPGLTLVHRWRPDEHDRFTDASDAHIGVYGGLGRKP